MKNLIITYFISFTSISFAEEFTFPNVNYSYAKIFLFNIGSEYETERPEFSVFRNNTYAASKLGEGWDFTPEMNLKLNAIFKSGVEMIVAGLSGCYIPRHGVIYFDDAGKPVASISFCFECQRVVFWSSQKLPEFQDPKSTKKQIENAEKQFTDITNLLVQNNVPVYKNSQDYILHIKESDQLYANSGEITFDYTHTAAFGNKSFSSDEVKSWITDANYKFRESSELQFSHREGDTTSWAIKIFTGAEGTKISFTGNDEKSVLNTASIKDTQIKLPNGISIGMSLSQIQSTFQVWDGLSNPSAIIVNYSNMNIRYIFENLTLRRIEFAMI